MRKNILTVLKIAVGCALFGLGFNLFLLPNDLNAGGISGLSMAPVHLLGFGTVGTFTALMNLPLFAIAGIKIGKRFFIGSLLGMALVALFIDAFAFLPMPQTEPLVGGLYGGVICGFGLGLVFATGASTGGSDIIVRLVKRKWRDVPIGTISIMFDLCVALLTGIVFGDITRTLYSGVAIFVSGQVVDAVVYRFDYSKTALIISSKSEEVAAVIHRKLERGATLLHGEGSFTHQQTKVILTAVKRRQVAELKQLVSEVDPSAFIILQEAQPECKHFVRFSVFHFFKTL
jgi:uncharacterized membrane-anchored protein YitT (DUF2179 family)